MTFDGTHAAVIVRELAQVSANVDFNAILPHIRETTTSCVQWAQLLGELMNNPRNIPAGPHIFNTVADKLREGKSVIVSLQLTQGGDHYFTIEPTSNGEARIMHGWQDKHPLRVEEPMPIDKIRDTLEKLTKFRHETDKVKLEKTFARLFGKDHAHLPDHIVRERVQVTSVFEGSPRESLASPTNRARLRDLSKVLAPPDRTRVSSVSNISSEMSEIAEAGQAGNRLASVRVGTGVGAAAGFVLGVAGALISGKDGEEVVLEGVKAGLGGAASGGVATAVMKNTVPTFARAGTSIVRANAAAGVALFGVFAIWDVTAWKMHKITAVELRKRLAEGAGAAGGGIAGGAAAGVAGGVWFGPIGAGIGAIVGGIAGGIGGMFAGKGIDSAIWDEGEDAVMNSYEFFGWHEVSRNTRPIKTPEEFQEAYDKKLKARPKKTKEEDWNNLCLGNFMILVKAMYPFFEDLMKIANEVREKKSDALTCIAPLVLQRIEEESTQEESVTPRVYAVTD